MDLSQSWILYIHTTSTCTSLYNVYNVLKIHLIHPLSWLDEPFEGTAIIIFRFLVSLCFFTFRISSCYRTSSQTGIFLSPHRFPNPSRSSHFVAPELRREVFPASQFDLSPSRLDALSLSALRCFEVIVISDRDSILCPVIL